MFARKVGNERRIPFEISADPFESEEHIKMLEKRIADLNAQKKYASARTYRGLVIQKFWHDDAWEDYLNWQLQDKKTLKKINNLIKSIDRNGYDCLEKLEPLTGNLSGFWSVRIDSKNRIVFRIVDETIEIAE